MHSFIGEALGHLRARKKHHKPSICAESRQLLATWPVPISSSPPCSTYPRLSPFNLGAIFNVKGGRSTCSFKRARCRPRGSSDLQFRGCSKSRDFATSPSRDPHHPSPIRAQAPSTTGPSSTSTSRGRYTLVRCLRRPAVSFKSPSLEIAKSRNLAEISQIATTISRRAREPGPGEHVRTSSWLAVRVSHWPTGRGADAVVETTVMVV